MADRPPRTALAEHERTLAFTRFEQLKPYLEDGVPLTRVATAANLPLRTAQRWVSRYRRAGVLFDCLRH